MSSHHLCAWSLLRNSLSTVPALICPHNPPLPLQWGPKIFPLVGSTIKVTQDSGRPFGYLWGQRGWACVGAGRPEPMADGPLCPLSTSVHNLIMTFASLIQPQSLTATHMPCSPTNSAILAGAKTESLINQAPRGDAHWTWLRWGSHFLTLCKRGALNLLSAADVM